MADKKKEVSYSAKDIYVLEGLEPVKKRPGMYIGSTSVDGLHHLIWEVTDNSLDEIMGGFGNEVVITLLPENRVRVQDNGRGIPVEKHPTTKKSALETVMTTLHAGGKFGGESYKIAGGLHGVGVSVVNALSQYVKVEVCRDGALYEQEYERGKPKKAVKKVGTCRKSGTTVTFDADPKVFPEIRYDMNTILTHFRQRAYLSKGAKIVIQDEREKPHASYTFYFEGGIVSYIKHLNRKEDPKHANIFYVEKTQDDVLVETAFQYTNDLQGKELGFANDIPTPEGGMHITGFRSAITRTINDYAKKNNLLKANDPGLTGDDIREGLTAIVSVKLREPQFEGQTKAKLGSPEARTVVESVLNEAIAEFLDKNPTDARQVIEKVLLASKARLAAKAARETVIRKGALEGMTLPGKLADCTSRKPEDSEIFIVEGDSAGGCFSGDTKVALTDGRNISFEELVKEHKRGKQNFCYAIGQDGHISVAPILSPRMTKKNAEVVKVILDNDTGIVCTPDHKFMLADGSFKEAQSLNTKDSIMPLYRQHSKQGGRITIDGYEMVFNPKDSRWIFTHILSDGYNVKNGAYSNSRSGHRHHKDFNKLNNNPDNIIRLTKDQHLELHRKFARITLHRPDVLEKLKTLRRSAEFRRKMSETMSSPKMKRMLSDRAKKQWENEDYKNYMAKKFLEFYYNNPEYRESNREILYKNQKNYWSQKGNRQKQSDRTRIFFEENPERKIDLSLIAKRQWKDENLLKWRSETTGKQWTTEFRAKRIGAYNQTFRSKALKILSDIYQKNGVVDIDEYNKVRKDTNDKSLLRYDTILERFFGNDHRKLSQAVRNFNHRAVKIVQLSEKTDVYDLEVPVTHNFALANGVFVHNSAKQGRDRMNQAILPLRGKILNVEKSRIDKMLANQEIKNLIIALGTAIAEEFDINKLRYHKVILMTDADVDGAHIRTLLLTLFYRYFPQIIEGGYLYVAQPPLYKISKGRDSRYAYNDAEKTKILNEFKKDAEAKKKVAKKTKKDSDFEVTELNGEAKEETEEKISGVSIQRYKGLGEMNPSQLWDTTMDPEKRVLLQVTVDDAEQADEVFDTLMGQEVLPRKKFIQAHAKSVKNLDI